MPNIHQPKVGAAGCYLAPIHLEADHATAPHTSLQDWTITLILTIALGLCDILNAVCLWVVSVQVLLKNPGATISSI